MTLRYDSSDEQQCRKSEAVVHSVAQRRLGGYPLPGGAAMRMDSQGLSILEMTPVRATSPYVAAEGRCELA
jgi:hypothetical protein